MCKQAAISFLKKRAAVTAKFLAYSMTVNFDWRGICHCTVPTVTPSGVNVMSEANEAQRIPNIDSQVKVFRAVSIQDEQLAG
jgi:hypothetical protein